jgi:hypothetical protein
LGGTDCFEAGISGYVLCVARCDVCGE